MRRQHGDPSRSSLSFHRHLKEVQQHVYRTLRQDMFVNGDHFSILDPIGPSIDDTIEHAGDNDRCIPRDVATDELRNRRDTSPGQWSPMIETSCWTLEL